MSSDSTQKDTKQICTWLRNRTRPRISAQSKAPTASKGTKTVLKLKKCRIPQSFQAYHDLTYDSIWKPIIDIEWQYFVHRWKEENTNKEFTQNRFAFMNSFMRERFNEEDEETKVLVEEHRQKKMQTSPNDLNATYQQ